MLNRRIYLILLPLALDLVIVTAPRLRISTLYAQLADLYRQAAGTEGLTPDMSTMATQMVDVLEMMGANSNLWGLLVNGSLLHVPGLAAAMGVNLELLPAREMTDPWLIAAAALLLALLSIILGVTFLNLLAVHLPIGNGPKQAGIGDFAWRVFRQSLRVVLFVLTVLFLFLLVLVPLLFGLTLVSLLSPALGSLLAVFVGAMSIVVFFYLYFVVPALVLDDLGVRAAMVQSIQLVRSNFVSTLGFILLTNLIALGLGLLFARLADMAPVGLVLSMVGAAYIGTGLAMALLIFYRTRILAMAEEVALFDRRR